MLLALVVAAALSQPQDPVAFGRAELVRVLGERAADVTVAYRREGEPEGYTIEPGASGKVVITGTDPVGAMYGAYEFAERFLDRGEAALGERATGKAHLRDRGLNLFLSLPWDYEKNDTDYAVESLIDGRKWWFHDEDYWTTLLDTMARSRLNWLDIHGTYDISVTDFPNLYAYFVTAPSFPEVGVPSIIKQANLAQLNHVIEMAHARGIRVSLMSYEAKLTVPHKRTVPYENTEANAYTYTKEVVERIIREAPGLDAIGFRIGESGRGESFFNCYTEAVAASGREIPLITRSWITRRQRVLPLARACKDFTVQIKYNGEHWGAPYMVAGGRVANWYSYSFEDYLSDAGSPEKNAKTWPGNPTNLHPATPSSSGAQTSPQEEGEVWPSNPYKIVWQVRANGTHRIFPFYNPEWVRRTIGCMKIGTASGYTIEGLDAYFPKRPEYYLADPSKKAYNWIHERDFMYWSTWGRLGYDPTVPDEVFDRQAVRMLTDRSDRTDQSDRLMPLVEAWKKASVLLPWAFMAYSLGPDHRSHAPELEWGGDTNAFIQGQGFDTHVFLPINEELANLATGGIDSRFGAQFSEMVFLARVPFDFASRTEAASTDRPQIHELKIQLRAMLDLANYNRARFGSAISAATAEATTSSQLSMGSYLSMQRAVTHLELLAEVGLYKPFTDRLRMHTNSFSWADESAKVRAEFDRFRSVSKVAPSINVRPIMFGPSGGTLTVNRTDEQVNCEFTSMGAERAWLLVKPLPSSTYFHRVPMGKEGAVFTASFKRERWGHMVAVEAAKGDGAARFPDVTKETPYLIIPSQSGPTPQIYSAEEAMTYLKPEVITPEKHGAMIIGTRGWRFFSSFDRTTRRKILGPVERGMKLLILQQDFNRYNLDFLPRPLRFEGGNWTTFDPTGQLGLEKTETADIMWQRFLPSDGWDVFGNGGLARLKIGKGEVWVCSARLMQRMHIPSAARNFVALLGVGGKTKPTILIDSNSEGADFSSSNHPDLMNSHDIPFLTLGEVIALEQGMDSFTPVPGPVGDDDVLGGKGKDMANAWLKARVVEAAKREGPAAQDFFADERKRRKDELMRSLGLDPMPEKTPMNARTTGTIIRRGYRIEKVVFESRSKFYVTMHVYTPYPPVTRRVPVIVNVNGHWAHKKNEDRVQLRAAFQALRGYVAVAIDSPGWSFEGNSLIERRAEGNHNDWWLVQGGSNATGYYVWDVMRELDLLEQRSDTDMKKVGITGASGGGLATLYAFAADDRFAAAVPVVYMSSMELAPDNGCLCNHVPGTMQIGDRSDVLGIQAPKPVFIIGAENDPEFPPNAMRRTILKCQNEWALFGKKDDVWGRVFTGGHDYSQPMREAVVGFFDKYLRGIGDGSPVQQPPIDALAHEDRTLLVLDPPPTDERTMRDLTLEYLEAGRKTEKKITAATVAAVNGGPAPAGDVGWAEKGEGNKRTVTFQGEPGLTTPGVLFLPRGTVRGVRIYVSDDGKATDVERTPPEDGYACLYLDLLGTGELGRIELRYPVYLGRSVPFIGSSQIRRAASALRSRSANVEVVARGPLATLAATYAALFEPSLTIRCTDALREWSDYLGEGVPPAAVQPRAHLLGSLEELRKQVRNGQWTYRGKAEPLDP